MLQRAVRQAGRPERIVDATMALARRLQLTAVMLLTVLLPGLALAAIAVTPGHGAAAVARSEKFCPALPPPTGNVIDIYPSQVGQLMSIILNASIGDTFLLHDGIYDVPYNEYIYVRADGVTIRSASGNREAVVIDGHYNDGDYGRNLITIAASGVTIADLTVKRSYDHPVHVHPHWEDTTDIENAHIYNVHVIDPGQQAIKINALGGHYADNGAVACSHIELTDTGRSFVWARNGSCYTGGVDGHEAWGWEIRDNLIEGFWCAGGGGGCDDDDLSEHAIHFWTGSRDTIVERNVLIDNARGVGFGLGSGGGRAYSPDPCPVASGGVGHYDGIARNNVIFAGAPGLHASDCGFDCGVCLEQACGTAVLHNTVASTQAPFSSIEWRWWNTNVDITNNLVTHNLRDRGGTATLAGNLDHQPLSLFVDGTGGDLHLAETAGEAIDKGTSAGVATDIDGEARDAAPDVGADEFHGVDLSSSRKTVDPGHAGVGDVLTYTIVLYNTSILSAPDAVLFDAIPPHTTYVPDSVYASSGIATDTGGIGWVGAVLPGASVTVTFQVTAAEAVAIVNTVVITDPYGTSTLLTALANARRVNLPLVLRNYGP